jgi:hypothetical protein
MPSRRKPKPAARAKERVEPHFGGRKREGARKPRKPQALKSADRPLRRAASSAPGLLPEMERQARHRDRRAVLPPASQGEPVTPLVMWTVYKHPKDYPGEYVARKFVITEDFYGPSNESISSRSLRDVRNVLRSLYRSLMQLKRPPTTNRISWRYGYDARQPKFLSCRGRRSSSPRSTLR